MKGFIVIGYNRVVLIGNLTRDPDYKQLASGQGVCQLGIASNRQYRNKQSGSMVQEVCFVDVDVYGAQAESCRQYLQKGRAVLIEGRLKFDTWESPEGQKRSKHSIIADRVVFLGSLTSDNADVEKVEESTAKQSNSFQGAKAPKPPQNSSPQQDTVEAQGKDNPQEGSEGIAFNDEPPFQDDLPF